MIEVKLTIPPKDWPIKRQTPGNSGVWNGIRFYINQDVGQCDFWVVYNGLDDRETSRVKKSKILITGEPPIVKKYNNKFMDQFDCVVSCDKDIKHRKLILSHQALPWHIGRNQTGNINISFSKDYDELKSIKRFEKIGLISIISSNKIITEGHRERYNFVMALKEHYGDKLEVFGRGIREVADKWDAIAPFKYHIALENNSYPHYWTEKLSDTFLAGAYPIYYGCENIYEYFSKNSLSRLVSLNVEEAVKTIDSLMANQMYEKSISFINESRNLCLDKYNLFPFIENIIDKYFQGFHQTSGRYTIKPELFFMRKNIFERAIGKLKSLL